MSMPIAMSAFLSTPSARRATVALCYFVFSFGISIHALREEGDASCQLLIVLLYLFLSTPSARRATSLLPESFLMFHISIHALREEGDSISMSFAKAFFHFYPRPPRGGRRDGLHHHLHRTDFYPRPPRGGRRGQCTGCRLRKHFYPRPPRGGRRGGIQDFTEAPQFLSTPSARRATPYFFYFVRRFLISIHALREEGDD